MIAKASHGHQGADRAEQWRAAAAAAVELYGGHPAVAFADLAAEVATEVRLLRAVAGRARRPRRRTRDGLPVGRPRPAGPQPARPGRRRRARPVAAIIGRPGPVPHRPSSSASFTGLAPRPARPARPTARASPCPRPATALLRTTLVRAADNARRQDPQLARIYYVQMVERGDDHLKACCVVAAHLAERAWTP